MKNTVVIAVAIFLIAACNSGQTRRYASSSPEIDTFKSSIKNYLEQDWDAYKVHYVDTVKFRNNTIKEKQESLEMAIEKWKEEHALFSSIEYIASEDFFEMVVTDEGETWVNFWGLWSAVLRANGQKFEIPVHVTVRFENGKIVEEHGYWDSSPITLALRELEANL